jgi:membrane protease YdiL (CAAX protease family)
VFGVLHDRWLAASCAGVAYAALSVRTGRLSEAIVAHAVTNACIAVWVLGSGDWSHWNAGITGLACCAPATGPSNPSTTPMNDFMGTSLLR